MKPMKEWVDCTHKERIERWENAARVLQGLSPHAKRKHWDMQWWGDKTDCGTVACAAGHCGLDPWFRQRGLRMDFTFHQHSEEDRGFYNERGWWSTEFNGADVDSFFGTRGSRFIFDNGEPRPVGKVIKEIKTYVKILKVDVERREGDLGDLQDAFPGR